MSSSLRERLACSIWLIVSTPRGSGPVKLRLSGGMFWRGQRIRLQGLGRWIIVMIVLKRFQGCWKCSWHSCVFWGIHGVLLASSIWLLLLPKQHTLEFSSIYMLTQMPCSATAKYWLYFLRGYPTRANPEQLPKTIKKYAKSLYITVFSRVVHLGSF